MIMGDFSYQIDWGFGSVTWYIQNNYLCAAHGDTFIGDQQHSNMPVITGNTTAETCEQRVSTKPTISPASGSYEKGQQITLNNGGRNTSTYYTTDGSTPVPGAGSTRLYTGPFAIVPPAKVKAVGMWGVPPQPFPFPGALWLRPQRGRVYVVHQLATDIGWDQADHRGECHNGREGSHTAIHRLWRLQQWIGTEAP